jgi:hypothetical protein
MEYIINEAEAKAAVFDLVKQHILDDDFEKTFAIAGDVLDAVLKAGKKNDRAE